jgi:hypothetical protein
MESWLRDPRQAGVTEGLGNLFFRHSLLAAGLVFLLDVFVPGANFAILYPVLLGCHAMVRPARSMWAPAVALSVLVMVGYLVKPLDGLDLVARLQEARMANRGLIIGVLLVIAWQVRRLRELSDPLSSPNSVWVGAHSSDDAIFESAERSLLAVIAVALALVIVAIDLVTAESFNPSILLPLPLLLAALSGGPRLAALMIPVAVALPFVDLVQRLLWAGHPSPAHVLINRVITAVACLAFAWLLRRYASSPQRA